MKKQKMKTKKEEILTESQMSREDEKKYKKHNLS